jgi:alkanesulfonate monooxygenase SsuD/methylene tetrahydromethanopterin reductase-like flavin-dependent oxidoreductase (luciferase family)
VSHRGQFYQVNDVSVVPRPIQQPHPPVYIAANSPETFPMVGSLGHSILVTPLIITSEGVRQGLEVYRQKLVENGHDPTRVKIIPTLAACAAESREKAEALLRPTIENYLGVLRGGRSRGSGRAVTLTCDEFLKNYAIVGDPQECTDQISRFKELFDCQGVLFWHNIGGMVPSEGLDRSMRLLADRVLPHFK